MERIKGKKEGTTVIQISLFVLTIIAMIALIWAGFSGEQSLFPFLLSVTLALSMSNLYVLNRNSTKKKWYGAAMVRSLHVLE